MKLKALTDMSLRKSADPNDPAYEEWYDWKAGETFDAPSNLKVDLALKRGIVEVVGKKVSDG
jgi:uncharacterized protein YaiE (UPF0345 family)